MRETQNHVQTDTQISPSTTNDELPSGGVLFDKYQLRRLLGVGAFAKVYHATNVTTGQDVAVKAVNKHKVLQGGFAANVEREISIMRRLRHPNVVHLYEVLATKTKVYFIMEFAAGGELFYEVGDKGRLSENLSRRYFQQLISAVHHCHSRGVFHRDLKLDNLLIDEKGNLKVSDFGLSAVKDQIRPDGLLHTACGTPAYVAPEILVKRGYEGAKVDVWSCGVVLFALTAGYLPFNEYNLTVMYRKIYRGQFRIPKWTSPDLRNLLSRLLDTNPQTRITLDEILQHPWLKMSEFRADRVLLKENELKDTQTGFESLNAFDLISFSSGLDMSGLFEDTNVTDSVERVISGVAPEKIVDKVEEVAKEAKVVVTRKEKDSGAKLEGQDGNLIAVVMVYRLTEELVVVEAKRNGRDVGCGEQFWKHKLRPLLSELAHKQ